MRKVLAGVLCAVVAAAPAVAYAATGNSETGSVKTNDSNPRSTETMQLRQDATHKLRTDLQRAKQARRRTHHRKREAQPTGSTASPQLQSIAACESGGNPRAIGGGGAYRGKYQFDYGTWASVGGSGDPAAAPEAEQDQRAAMLLARSGTTPWPICGR